jgi:hypothetical protein
MGNYFIDFFDFVGEAAYPCNINLIDEQSSIEVRVASYSSIFSTCLFEKNLSNQLI